MMGFKALHSALATIAGIEVAHMIAKNQFANDIALACRTFDVSETYYRYSRKLNDENEQIADLLVGLTRAKKSWGFGYS